MPRMVWFVFLLLVAVSLTGCGGGDEKQPPQKQAVAVETPFAEAEPPAEATPGGAGRRLTRAGEQIRFEVNVANLTTGGSQPPRVAIGYAWRPLKAPSPAPGSVLVSAPTAIS